MSAASRAAAEASARFAALKKPNRVKMSDCPACESPIYANQKTAWVSIGDKPFRVHHGCNTCIDCGQSITPHHFRDTGSATTLPAGSCPVLFERRT